jgi:hypothetical protein
MRIEMSVVPKDRNIPLRINIGTKAVIASDQRERSNPENTLYYWIATSVAISSLLAMTRDYIPLIMRDGI